MIRPGNNLDRLISSIKCGVHGFAGIEQVTERPGLQVLEGMLFGLDLWSFKEGAVK